MNLQSLTKVDAEQILQDMGGWMAGKDDYLLEGYEINVKDVKFWISQANAYSFKIFAQIP